MDYMQSLLDYMIQCTWDAFPNKVLNVWVTLIIDLSFEACGLFFETSTSHFKNQFSVLIIAHCVLWCVGSARKNEDLTLLKFLISKRRPYQAFSLYFHEENNKMKATNNSRRTCPTQI